MELGGYCRTGIEDNIRCDRTRLVCPMPSSLIASRRSARNVAANRPARPRPAPSLKSEECSQLAACRLQGCANRAMAAGLTELEHAKVYSITLVMRIAFFYRARPLHISCGHPRITHSPSSALLIAFVNSFPTITKIPYKVKPVMSLI